MHRAGVPEAPVNEDGHLGSWEHHVRSAARLHRPNPDPIPESSCIECLPKRDLRTRVALAIAPHHLADSRRRSPGAHGGLSHPAASFPRLVASHAFPANLVSMTTRYRRSQMESRLPGSFAAAAPDWASDLLRTSHHGADSSHAPRGTNRQAPLLVPPLCPLLRPDRAARRGVAGVARSHSQGRRIVARSGS
jgi:hypothetical protein